MRPATPWLASLVLAACTGSALAQQAPAAAHGGCAPAPCRLAFKASLPANVPFRGIVSGEAQAGSASSMTYQLPAGSGMAGMLTAIATHGALAESSRQSAISKAQLAADAVLAPYQEVLDKFATRELMARALDALPKDSSARLLVGTDAGAPAWVIESTPVFAMAQDQTALVLDNAITVRGPAATDPVFQALVRVVSDAQPPQDAQTAWLAEQGHKLKQESVLMYAHSLQLLLRALQAPDGAADAPHQTFRYMEGQSRKVERAQLVAQACGRTVVRTLRGGLLSIPQPLPQPLPATASTAETRPEDGRDACKTPARYAL